MTTPNAVARRIRSLLDELLRRDLVLLPNAVSADHSTVSWKSPTPLQNFVDFVEFPTIRTYRRWADAGEYSALLPDASLLQMRYSIENGSVSAHRLAYVPCPYRIDQDLLVTEPLSDVLDLHGGDSHESITMQSALRFDFDPLSSGPGHPASHLTMNVSSCRIACDSPIMPEVFVSFVFKHFYAKAWNEHFAFFSSLPQEPLPRTLSEGDSADVHVRWLR